jgi:hypothetical protein
MMHWAHAVDVAIAAHHHRRQTKIHAKLALAGMMQTKMLESS